MNTSYAVGWLRAFLDGEGCVVYGRNKYIDFANTEESVIQDAKTCLDFLEIEYKTYKSEGKPPRKPITHVRVSQRDSVARFIRLVGSSIKYKADKMEKILDWHKRPGQPYRNRWSGPEKPSKEALGILLGIGLSHKEIAVKTSVPVHSVSKYIRDYGLSKQYRQGPEPAPEEVRKAYWEGGLSLREVGALFGYRGAGINKFMKRHNIPRKPLGWQSKRKH